MMQANHWVGKCEGMRRSSVSCNRWPLCLSRQEFVYQHQLWRVWGQEQLVPRLEVCPLSFRMEWDMAQAVQCNASGCFSAIAASSRLLSFIGWHIICYHTAQKNLSAVKSVRRHSRAWTPTKRTCANTREKFQISANFAHIRLPPTSAYGITRELTWTPRLSPVTCVHTQLSEGQISTCTSSTTQVISHSSAKSALLLTMKSGI